MRAEHREHLRELLRRTLEATKPAELRAIYREAIDARLLAAEVDGDGQTLEHILWNRRTDLERPRSA